MAFADMKENLPETDLRHQPISMQLFGKLIMKLVNMDSVAQMLIDSEIISKAEEKTLNDTKVADQRLRYLQTLITECCNRNDLQALKSFIDIMDATHNVDIAHKLSLIYDQKVNNVATVSRLSKETSLVRNLKNEISRLQRSLEEKERHLESLTDQRNKLVDHYRKVADDQDETFRKEKLSLEKQIKIKDEDLLFVKNEMGELTSKKNVLENEVELKSNVIRKRSKEIVEKERELWEAIEESNRLRLKIDALQQQHSEAMVEDKQMTKKIEIFKIKLAEKEETIMNLKKNKTVTVEELEEQLRNITGDQTAMIKQQNEKIDDQMAMIKEQNGKINDQAAIMKQQSDDQMAMIRQHNEKMDAIMRALSIQEKK